MIEVRMRFVEMIANLDLFAPKLKPRTAADRTRPRHRSHPLIPRPGDPVMEREKLADLVEFAIGPLEQMRDEGAYWSDEVDDEASKVTPDEVIAAVRAAAAALREGGGWREIESAPKDARVLICGGTYTYDADGYDGTYPCTHTEVATWTRDGWKRAGYGSEYNGEYWHEPTHWQPLPEPPMLPEGESNGDR